ncbi:sugar phosphate isomerase/epimerase family protein [Devosia submarina]|uniref:sugar phosphate isomerase/epimerase family protein n=1 Tax=Devosia submarina TaxID=1173082 RepID=UPI000D3D409B|nr:sugar phosphate isomerase/epimerase family protein [Devosia submarina]
MDNLAVSTALFDGHDMAVAFEEIAQVGLRKAEPAFIGGYSNFTEATLSEDNGTQLARQAREAGLTIAAVSAHMDLGKSGDEPLEQLQRRIRFVSACDSSVLITNAGQAEDRDRIEATIEAALPLAETLGVMLALENPGHGMGAAISDISSGKDLIGRLDHSLVRLNYDAGNVYTYSGATLQPGQDLRGRDLTGIGYIHLKDIAAAGDDWSFCPLGDGLVDLAGLFKMISSKFSMSLELPLHLNRPGRGVPVRAARLPIAHLREALTRSLYNLNSIILKSELDA